MFNTTESTRSRAALMKLMAALALLTTLFGCAPLGMPSGEGAASRSYATALRDALRVYASDMQGYHFRSTPVGHFGVGSIYLDDLADADLSSVETRWYLGGPEAWLLPGTAATERPRAPGHLIAEGSLGAFSADSSQSSALHAQAGVAVLSAITANASLDHRKGVQTSFRASEVRNRRLNWAEFETALKAGRISPAVADVVKTGRFVIAAADVVLIGYRAEVTVDESLNPALAASLRTSVLLPHLRGAGASFSVSENARGHFVAVASQPVIAAVLFKRPPPQAKAMGTVGALPDLDAWPAARIDDAVVDAVEAGVIKGQR